MQRYEDWPEHFIYVEKMPNRSSAKVPAAVTVAILLYWVGIADVGAVSQPQGAVLRKGISISSVSRRQDAVEHVDAGFYGSYDIGRRADTHQVARLILRQKLVCVSDCRYHIVMSLADT